jgi:hypothetical protein
MGCSVELGGGCSPQGSDRSDTGWVLTQTRTHCSAMLKQSLSRKATFDEGVYAIQPQTILLPNWMVMGPGANDKLHDSYWLGPFPLHPEGNKVDTHARAQHVTASRNGRSRRTRTLLFQGIKYIDRSGPTGRLLQEPIKRANFGRAFRCTHRYSMHTHTIYLQLWQSLLIG